MEIPAKDPWSIIPMKVDPSYKGINLSVSDLEQMILEHPGLRTTYLFAGFDKLHVTDRVPTAGVMRNAKTCRLAMMVNPKFVRKMALVSAAERSQRRNYAVSRSKDMGFFNMDLSSDDKVSRYLRKATHDIVKHEFSHVWFQHLERDTSHSKLITNITVDALVNYHMKVNLNMQLFDRWQSTALLGSALTFIGWVPFRRYTNEIDVDVLKNGLVTGTSVRDYVAARCYAAVRHFANPTLTDGQLLKLLGRYATAVSEYSETCEELGNLLCHMFPNSDSTLSPNQPPQQPQKPATNQGQGQGCGQPSESTEGEDPEVDADNRTVDPKTEPLTIEDNEYVPLAEGDINPELQDQLPEILKSCGAGDAFIHMLNKEFEKRKLSQDTVKVIIEDAPKSLMKEVKRAFELIPEVSPIATTLIPNRYPLRSDLVRHNNLQLDIEPRFKAITAREKELTRKRVCIFIDTSGSMHSAWDKLYSFCEALSNECELELYQFSTEVFPLPIADLKHGLIRTTYGTCVDKVAKKMSELSATCAYFVIIGDRQYSGCHALTKVAQPVKILDILYYDNSKNESAWFADTSRVKVNNIVLTRDFEVCR